MSRLKKDLSFWRIVPRGEGGGTLIFSYIRRLGSFYWVQNFEFQYFFRFSEKWIFLGVWRFCGYFLGSSQNWTIFICILGSFLKVKVQNEGYFFELLKFQYFWGAWNSFFFFLGGGGVKPSLRLKKTWEYPPATWVLWLFVFCGSFLWCCGLACSVLLWSFLIILTLF